MEVVEFFSSRTDEHVTHEEGMVSSGAYNADIDAVSFIPSSEAIDNVYSVSSIEIIDRSLPIDFPDLYPELLVEKNCARARRLEAAKDEAAGRGERPLSHAGSVRMQKRQTS